MRKLFIILFILQISSLSLFTKTDESILEKVKKLKIGVKNLYIGEKFSSKNAIPIKTNIKKTLKYKINDVVVTVDKKTFTIIGIYKYYKNVSSKVFKQTISYLMIRFGEPTLDAHGKMIYWLYNEDGKISSDKYFQLKRRNIFIKPLIMVKFNSNNFFSEVEKNTKKKLTFYYIIYSEPLIKFLLNM